MTKPGLARMSRWIVAGVGLAAASYAAYAGVTWYRYGEVTDSSGREDADPLLDRFIPLYEVAERHHVRIAAPAALTLQAAIEMDLQQSLIVRAIFRARELVMGSHPSQTPAVGSFISQMQAIGWGVLAEQSGHEIVMGAVTQPWLADVVFRPLPPENFAAFNEPDYVKIVWTLRADPLGDAESMFRTETRVLTTDAGARAKFRRYWAMASPGIVLIRRLMLRPLKAEAERRARECEPGETTPQGVVQRRLPLADDPAAARSGIPAPGSLC